MIRPARIDDLVAKARYHRLRRDPTHASGSGPRPTSPHRLTEFERARDGAQNRLREARNGASADADAASRRS